MVEAIDLSFEKTWNLLHQKLSLWLREVILALPNAVLAVVVIVVFWLAARLMRSLAERLLRRLTQNRHVDRLLSGTLFFGLMATGIFVGLGVLGLEKALFSLLAGAGIVGLALSLAFQGIASNFMAGIYLSFQRPFQIGNLIESNKFMGTVERLNLFWTEIHTPQGQVVLLPNRKVFEEAITNYSALGRRRIEVKARVRYEQDLEHARRAAMAALAEVPHRSAGREVELFYEELAESAVTFVIRIWLDAVAPGDVLAAQSLAIERLKRAFETEKIELSAPTTTLTVQTP